MEGCVKRRFRVLRRDLIYLKFILEAYEGMATMSTVDQREGIVELTIPSVFNKDIDQLLISLQHEIALEECRP